MKVTLLSNDAILPTYGSEQAAGLDLYSTANYMIYQGSRTLIPIDISIELPEGTFAHILPRSGLALKHGIHIGAGVIDSDYRGTINVLLFNLGAEPFHIKKGDRIAQMVIKKYERVVLEKSDTLSETERGSGGFGSTGVSYFS